MRREVKTKVRGFNTMDGAGVKLVRVLGHETVEEFDPILMLDSFDSKNPEDYIAGFPMHPHRGIETISYVNQGNMQHADNIGFEDTVTNGGVQWMTAGSGIIHEERLPASDRMLGVQLWLNLPKEYKMVKPEYHNIKSETIPEIEFEGGKIRVLSGSYKGHKSFQGKYLPLDYYDIELEPNSKVEIETEEENSVMFFTLVGDVSVEKEKIKEKTAVKLTQGTSVVFESGDKKAKILFMSSKRLNEPVAWGGPIVMNTYEELNQAFVDLRTGNFIKK